MLRSQGQLHGPGCSNQLQASSDLLKTSSDLLKTRTVAWTAKHRSDLLKTSSKPALLVFAHSSLFLSLSWLQLGERDQDGLIAERVTRGQSLPDSPKNLEGLARQ